MLNSVISAIIIFFYFLIIKIIKTLFNQKILLLINNIINFLKYKIIWKKCKKNSKKIGSYIV